MFGGVTSYPTLHEDFVALAVANGWRQVEALELALSTMPGLASRRPASMSRFMPFNEVALPCIFIFRYVPSTFCHPPCKLPNHRTGFHAGGFTGVVSYGKTRPSPRVRFNGVQ